MENVIEVAVDNVDNAKSLFSESVAFIKERPVDAAIIAAGTMALGWVVYKGYDHLTSGDLKVSKKVKPTNTEANTATTA